VWFKEQIIGVSIQAQTYHKHPVLYFRKGKAVQIPTNKLVSLLTLLTLLR